jgi:hypothetical protein
VELEQVEARLKKSDTSFVKLVFKRVIDGFVYCPLIGETVRGRGRAPHARPGEEKFKKGEGTSRHWRHLRRHHPKFLAEALNAYDEGRGEQFINDEIERCASRGQTQDIAVMMRRQQQRQQVSKVLLSHISQAVQLVRHGQSFRSLDSPEYAQSFVDMGLDANVAPKSSTLKSTLLPAMVSVAEEKVRLIFSSHLSVALTADAWTSRSGEPFLGVTAHFVDESWRLCACTLDLIYAPDKHSGEHLQHLMLQAVDERAGKHLFVPGIVVDGARAALNSAVRLASTENVLWCTAHRLSLVVGDVLKEHGSVIADVRRFISEVRNAIKLRQALKRYQRENGAPNPLSLKVDVPTSVGYVSTHILTGYIGLQLDPLRKSQKVSI